jgi:hypothetical protein
MPPWRRSLAVGGCCFGSDVEVVSTADPSEPAPVAATAVTTHGL